MSTLLETVTTSEADGRAIVDAATRETIGYAPVHSTADLDQAIAAAREAQPAWAALGHPERSRILNAIADDIEANAEELAQLLSREQGKPLNGPNARFEVGACAVWTRNAADTQSSRKLCLKQETPARRFTTIRSASLALSARGTGP